MYLQRYIEPLLLVLNFFAGLIARLSRSLEIREATWAAMCVCSKNSLLLIF